LFFYIDNAAVLDAIYEVQGMLKKKNTSKQGSRLGASEYHCFSPVIANSADVNNNHQFFEAVKGIIRQHTLQMQKCYNRNEMDEVDYVQPNSKLLMKDLVNLLSRGKSSDFTVIDKASGSGNISYQTSLYNDRELVASVSGEFDEGLTYAEKVIWFIEDKNLDCNILAKSVLAQGFSELKSSFDSLMKNLACIAPTTFWGVIRSGRDWAFLLRLKKTTGAFSFRVYNCLTMVLAL